MFLHCSAVVRGVILIGSGAAALFLRTAAARYAEKQRQKQEESEATDLTP